MEANLPFCHDQPSCCTDIAAGDLSSRPSSKNISENSAPPDHGTGAGESDDAPVSPTSDASLCEQLPVLDTSLQFMLLLIGGILLSYYSLWTQREQLCHACRQIPITEKDLYPVQIASSILVLAALSYFYVLSSSFPSAQDPVSQRTGQLSSFSSGLVLLAAGIRLYNLIYTRCHPLPQEQDPTETAKASADLETAG